VEESGDRQDTVGNLQGFRPLETSPVPSRHTAGRVWGLEVPSSNLAAPTKEKPR